MIGWRALRRLVGQGHSVTGLVRRSADADWLRGLGAEAVMDDAFDRNGLMRVVTLAASEM